MPQLTPVLIIDRASTPVTHTYIPAGEENGKNTFTVSSGVPVGDKKLTVSLSKSQLRTKVELVLSDPVLVTETVNGVDRPMIDRTSYGSVKFSFPNTSTLQERKDLVGKMASTLGADQTFMMEVCEELKGIY
jgi:hypothetical protein